VVATIRATLGLRRFYVADLDAIEGIGNNLGVVRRLIQDHGCVCMVDSGVSDAGAARHALDAGVAQVVVGSETLTSLDALAVLADALPADRRVFSLDVRDGRVVSRCAALGEGGPQGVARRVAAAGFTTLIVLALSRIGTRAGPDLATVRQVRDALATVYLLVGGGVRDAGDLEELEREGVQGVLVGSALHTGALPRAVLARWCRS
jgi:phosphoribosylformimino-5-aminoimidazole carboxamide ribotide isomerase